MAIAGLAPRNLIFMVVLQGTFGFFHRRPSFWKNCHKYSPLCSHHARFKEATSCDLFPFKKFSQVGNVPTKGHISVAKA